MIVFVGFVCVCGVIWSFRFSSQILSNQDTKLSILAAIKILLVFSEQRTCFKNASLGHLESRDKVCNQADSGTTSE